MEREVGEKAELKDNQTALEACLSSRDGKGGSGR